MKRKPIHIVPPQMIISSDAAKTGGWGAASQGISTGGGGGGGGGTWMQAESQLHINTQEPTATICKPKSRSTMYLSGCLILKTLRKVCREQVKGMILITPLRSTQPWYPLALTMSIKNHVLIPMNTQTLKGPQGESHPLILNSTMKLVACMASGDISLSL